MSVATGLAQISKFSMFHLFILIPVLALAIFIYKRKNNGEPLHFSWKKTFAFAGLFLLINWLIICTSHLFYQVFLPIKDYTFMSDPFNGLQQFFLDIIPGLPVPLPSSYIGSMDAVLYFDDLGGGVKGSLNGAPYILGESSINGFWYYYFVTLFFKLPIVFMYRCDV